jgi:hypothetical protein
VETGLEIMSEGKGRGLGQVVEALEQHESSAGIVVIDRSGESVGNGGGPRIAAFIWGGKVPPAPTLPYGRWKGAA